MSQIAANNVEDNAEDNVFYKIYKYGKYYNPSKLHYTNVGIDPEDVGCDRCLQENISSCIGWGEYDLCLKCASIIDEKFDNGLLIIDDSESFD